MLAAVGLGASQARSTLGIALAAWSAKSTYTYPVAALAACIHQIPTDIGVALASAALAQDCEQVEAALRAMRRVSKPRKKKQGLNCKGILGMQAFQDLPLVCQFCSHFQVFHLFWGFINAVLTLRETGMLCRSLFKHAESARCPSTQEVRTESTL